MTIRHIVEQNGPFRAELAKGEEEEDEIGP